MNLHGFDRIYKESQEILLYPDSWHLYGCGLLSGINSVVVECDVPYVCMYKIIKLFLTLLSLFFII